jgi:hypothetical protein
VVAKFICDACTVRGTRIPQHVINVQCDTIAEGRRQAADHVGGRYKVPAGPVRARVRLGFVEGPSLLPADAAVDRALAHV